MNIKSVGLLALLLSIFLLPSCPGIKTEELSDRLIIEAIGIDADEEGVSVTLQALDTGASGSGEGKRSEEKTKIYNFYSDGIGSAFAAAQNAAGLLPLYSHARILLIGRKTAERGVADILDFFLREYTARSDIPIAVAEGRAADIIGADIADGVTDASVLERLLKNGHENGQNTSTPLYRFVDLMLSETDAAYCPVLSITRKREEAKYDAAVTGTAIFTDDRMITVTDTETTEGLLLLLGQAGSMPFTVRTENGDHTLSTVKNSIKIKPSLKDGKAIFTIRTRVVCDLTEYKGRTSRAPDTNETHTAERALTDAISAKEKRVLAGLFSENGADVCRFARRILLRYPEFYEIYSRDMAELTDYELEVTVSIRRTGREALR